MNNVNLKWLQRKLFPNWYHSLLTLLALYFLYLIIPPILKWSILDANFIGDGPTACTSGGACWVFIRMRFDQFMYGFYPRDLLWRINITYIIFILCIITLIAAPKFYKKCTLVFLLTAFPIIAFFLYYGGIFGLDVIDTYSWGGLHLTLLMAVTSIIFSLPIGILLALCMRSSLPVTRILSIAFTELWHGVPLISVLFMASVLLPMFFAQDVYIDRVLRALVGITLFYSAYMAEVIRGGLRALPQGQYEAVQTLGFKYFTGLYLVILPQVLKNVIPGIVHIFVNLFKDTTLISLIGLFDLLGMVQAASDDPRWQDYGLEGYLFAAFVYWLFCYSMSRYSVYLEYKLNVGHKK